MSTSVENPFTQSWIQALTLASDRPITRTIKPKLDWIDILSRSHLAGRELAARELWEYAAKVPLLPVLTILPIREARWEFQDEKFLFRQEQVPQLKSLEDWSTQLGIVAADFGLIAEVTGTDWAGLVRQEAVRQQRSFSTAAGGGANLQLPCTARWEADQWVIRFDAVEWLSVCYEEPVTVARPEYASVESNLLFTVAEADQQLATLKTQPHKQVSRDIEWIDSVIELSEFHHQAFGNSSPWMRQAWHCVWPTVYRERNLLKGKADLVRVRREMAECLTSVPELTVWMFVFAKLVCLARLGNGLGLSADYG